MALIVRRPLNLTHALGYGLPSRSPNFRKKDI